MFFRLLHLAAYFCFKQNMTPMTHFFSYQNQLKFCLEKLYTVKYYFIHKIDFLRTPICISKYFFNFYAKTLFQKIQQYLIIYSFYLKGKTLFAALMRIAFLTRILFLPVSNFSENDNVFQVPNIYNDIFTRFLQV